MLLRNFSGGHLNWLFNLIIFHTRYGIIDTVLVSQFTKNDSGLIVNNEMNLSYLNLFLRVHFKLLRTTPLHFSVALWDFPVNSMVKNLKSRRRTQGSQRNNRVAK